MNTRDNAINQIIEFLNSDEKSMLLTGTYQNEKHKLVLSTIAKYVDKLSSILFRANSMKNISTFFEDPTKTYKTGEGYSLGKHSIFFDSINPVSWNKTKLQYDFAVLYPLDSTMKDTNKEKTLDDLFFKRNVEKIFLVSWTDNLGFDYSSLSLYCERHVEFDALEENPEYHQRMIDLLNKHRKLR